MGIASWAVSRVSGLLLPLQTENTSTPEGWAKLEHVDSGELPNMMDEGELPVDADGNFVAGVPIDPNDPRTAHMKPAGKTSPPGRSGVSCTSWLLREQLSVFVYPHEEHLHCCSRLAGCMARHAMLFATFATVTPSCVLELLKWQLPVLACCSVSDCVLGCTASRVHHPDRPR